MLEANGAVAKDDAVVPARAGADGENVVRLFADLIVGPKPAEDGETPTGGV